MTDRGFCYIGVLFRTALMMASVNQFSEQPSRLFTDM